MHSFFNTTTLNAVKAVSLTIGNETFVTGNMVNNRAKDRCGLCAMIAKLAVCTQGACVCASSIGGKLPASTASDLLQSISANSHLAKTRCIPKTPALTGLSFVMDVIDPLVKP